MKNMKEVLTRMNLMEKEHIILIMEIYIKEILNMELKKEMELIKEMIMLFLKEIGMMIYLMVMG
jgi:hypothetical protein